MLNLGYAIEAHAQSPILIANSGPWYERMNGDAVSVIGDFLVGIRFGSGDGRFDPEEIEAFLPPSVQGRTVCVSIASQDGRYFAQNLYQVPVASEPLFKFETPSKFKSILKTIRSDQIGIRIALTEACDDPTIDGYIPAVLGNALPTTSDMLVMDFNAEPQEITVQLLKDRSPVGTPATCDTDTHQIRISFTTRCVLAGPSDLALGHYAVEIVKQERFSTNTTRFPLFQPPP